MWPRQRICEIDLALGKGLLPIVPLSCLCGVTAPPCYQHRSWELVQWQASSASSRVVVMTTPSLLLILRKPISPRWGLDHRRLDYRHATNPTNAHTHIFSGHVHKYNSGLNFAAEVRSTENANFIPNENLYPCGMSFFYTYLLFTYRTVGIDFGKKLHIAQNCWKFNKSVWWSKKQGLGYVFKMHKMSSLRIEWCTMNAKIMFATAS